MLYKKTWLLGDFGCAGDVDDDAIGGTYLAPESRRRLSLGKSPRISFLGDAFALGMMIIDCLCNFRYWLSVEHDPNFENYEIPFELPATVDGSIRSKLSGLVAKDPLKRLSISAFSKSSIFKVMNTKLLQDIGDQNIVKTLGKIEERVQKVDSHMKQGLVVLDNKISKMHTNLNHFLPAIQENLMQVLSLSGVPNRFVLIPETSSFTDSFYKRYRLYFLCDHGGHLVKGEDLGYSMLQITQLGKGIMIVAKVLISIAMKQLIGISDGINQGLDSLVGVTGYMNGIISNPLVEGIKDIKVDVDTLTNGLKSLESSISKLKSDDLVQYDIQNEQDWVRIFGPIKPILKQFLEGKSPERMGVQACRDEYGKAVWLCKEHSMKSMGMKSKLESSVQSLAFSNGSISKPVPSLPTTIQAVPIQPPLTTLDQRDLIPVFPANPNEDVASPIIDSATSAKPILPYAAGEYYQPALQAGRELPPVKEFPSNHSKIARPKTRMILILSILFILGAGGTAAGVAVYLSSANQTSSSSHSTVTSSTFSSAPIPTNVPVPDRVSTFAGSGQWGTQNGVAAFASFQSPRKVVFDWKGNAFVADYGAHLIRKIDTTGIVSTFAGNGTKSSTDGFALSSSFDSPSGLCMDSFDNIFVTESEGHRIRKITPDGFVMTVAGNGVAGIADGVGNMAEFNSPRSCVFDSHGNMFIADKLNNVIRMMTPDYTVSTFAGGTYGSADAIGRSAQFVMPSGLAIDSMDNLYVADYGNHKIRRISPMGLVTTLAGTGFPGNQDGEGHIASFWFPDDIALGGSDFYIADSQNQLIRKMSDAFVISTFAGTPLITGRNNDVRLRSTFSTPRGITTYHNHLYIADSGNSVIRSTQFQ
jgi:hypothetical protein